MPYSFKMSKNVFIYLYCLLQNIKPNTHKHSYTKQQEQPQTAVERTIIQVQEFLQELELSNQQT